MSFLTSLLLGAVQTSQPSLRKRRQTSRFRSTSKVMLSRCSQIFIRQPRKWCVMTVTGWLIFRLHRHSVTRWNKLFICVFLLPSPRQSGMRYIMPCVIPDIVCARPMDRRTTFIVCRYPLFIIRWDRSA